MKNAVWSVRNKLENLQRALRDGELDAARMYSHELSTRLEYLEAAIDAVDAGIRAGICNVPGHPPNDAAKG